MSLLLADIVAKVVLHQGCQKFPREPLVRFSCKRSEGTSSPLAKFIGDFGGATEVIRIVDRFPVFGDLAKNYGTDATFDFCNNICQEQTHAPAANFDRCQPVKMEGRITFWFVRGNHDLELSEKSRLRLDIYCCRRVVLTMMSWLMDRPSPGPSPRGLVVKNRIEIFSL